MVNLNDEPYHPDVVSICLGMLLSDPWACLMAFTLRLLQILLTDICQFPSSFPISSLNPFCLFSQGHVCCVQLGAKQSVCGRINCFHDTTTTKRKNRERRKTETEETYLGAKRSVCGRMRKRSSTTEAPRYGTKAVTHK
jgi:hypothetical protein